MPARRARIALGLILASISSATIGALLEPVIDMHAHAVISKRTVRVEACPGDQPILMLPVDPVRSPSDAPTISCPRPILSAISEDELRDGTIAEMRRWNVVRSVLIGTPEVTNRWMKQASGLFIPAAVPAAMDSAAMDQFRALVRSGRVQMFAEAGLQYQGLRADDPLAEPLWELAEELDVPVGIHLGEGTPLTGADVRSRYSVSLTSPFQLEGVLKNHPKLRIYVMHAASPLTDEMIAMMFAYPGIYVDISANVWNMPRAQFYAQLKTFVDAGYSKRILFGSDQTLFPQAIGIAIRSIRDAPFLSAQQKRDILYNNAARFLRLTPAQIAADHAPRK